MNDESQKRLKWIKLYQQTGNASAVCSRCEISRPTLRKWLKRYEAMGLEGLEDQSKRPHTIHTKVTREDECRILDLRVKS